MVITSRPLIVTGTLGTTLRKLCTQTFHKHSEIKRTVQSKTEKDMQVNAEQKARQTKRKQRKVKQSNAKKCKAKQRRQRKAVFCVQAAIRDFH